MMATDWRYGNIIYSSLPQKIIYYVITMIVMCGPHPPEVSSHSGSILSNSIVGDCVLGCECLSTHLVSIGDTTATIMGRITSSDTGEPCPAVNVFLFDKWEIMTQYYSFTDENGRYQIESIPPGTYYLRAAYVSYVTVTLDSFSLDGSEIRKIDLILVPREFPPIGLGDRLWPSVKDRYQVGPSISNVTDQDTMLLPREIPIRWEFSARLINNKGATIDSGTVEWDFEDASDFNIEAYNYSIWRETERSIVDDIIAGPWRIKVTGFNGYISDEFILIETRVGLFKAYKSRDNEDYWIDLMLPENPEVGIDFSRDVDSGYNIIDIRPISVNSLPTILIETKFWSLYWQEYRYRWAEGWGLLEYLESIYKGEGEGLLATYTHFYCFGTLERIIRPE